MWPLPFANRLRARAALRPPEAGTDYDGGKPIIMRSLGGIPPGRAKPREVAELMLGGEPPGDEATFLDPNVAAFDAYFETALLVTGADRRNLTGWWAQRSIGAGRLCVRRRTARKTRGGRVSWRHGTCSRPWPLA